MSAGGDAVGQLVLALGALQLRLRHGGGAVGAGGSWLLLLLALLGAPDDGLDLLSVLLVNLEANSN